MLLMMMMMMMFGTLTKRSVKEKMKYCFIFWEAVVKANGSLLFLIEKRFAGKLYAYCMSTLAARLVDTCGWNMRLGGWTEELRSDLKVERTFQVLMTAAGRN